MKGSDFGKDFLWGTATAAYQIEGAWNEDSKTESIWDKFSHTRGKIRDADTGDVACDFYHRYPQDIALMKQMQLQAFRFSFAWNRILPNGTGAVNQKGLDFYHRVIDSCLQNGLEPWPTLYHWDLPQVLQEKGGWKNRDVVSWFAEFANVVTQTYGDKVKNWMVLNEPLSFVALGYFLGIHAPGLKGIGNFLPAAHHANLAKAEGGRIVRRNVPNANVGTTEIFVYVEPRNPNSSWDAGAARRFDAVMNRLFIEPTLGMGYPYDAFPVLKRIEKFFKPEDHKNIEFDFDFIGLQTYTREVVKFSLWNPIIWGDLIPPEKRGVEKRTAMGWEVYPEGIYKIAKRLSAYKGVKNIYITENGTAFPDVVSPNKEIDDKERIQFLKDHLAQVLKAKNEGVNIKGYFVWSFMDNFEWHEGFMPHFGLVYVDYKTQERIVKNSGKWFTDLITT